MFKIIKGWIIVLNKREGSGSGECERNKTGLDPGGQQFYESDRSRSGTLEVRY
jgi:hypothetical protein